MQKSVLVEIVRSLNRKEIREINKWLQSPSHNQRQDVPRLFEFLVKSLSDNSAAPEKEKAWKHVFPGDAYDDARMRQTMYFLLKAIEEYLVFDDYTRDNLQFQIALTRIYRERSLEKAYKQAHRLSGEHLESQPLRNSYYLLQKFFLNQEYSERMGDFMQSASSNLQQSADALEKWYITEKLQISNAMLTHHKVYPMANYDLGMIDETLQYASEHNLTDDPIIAVYYYAYMTTNRPEEEQYFGRFEQLILDTDKQAFKAREMRDFYLAAINYCVSKINQGRLEYYRRAFQIYKKGMENGILIENNSITRYTFGNAVVSAIRIGEFDWAERFIQDFQQYLEEKQRNSIVNFNLSRVYFEKGDYDKAQRLLLQFEYDDMLLNIIAKTMLLKIYYEQGELDAFESLVESMRIYLQRKEALDSARKAAYKNLVSLMKKLLHLNPYSKAQTERLRTLVMETNPLMERDWLLRQLEPRR